MYNHTVLVGRATRDPETKLSQNGNKVVKFSLVTNTGWGDYKRADFHNCICFGKLADIVDEYVKKGSMLVVDGETNHERYEKDDQVKYYTQVKVNNLRMVDSKKDSGEKGARVEDERRERRQRSQRREQEVSPVDDNDIPF